MRVLFFLLLSVSISAQSYDGLYRKKVKTVNSTIETLYGVISGEKGEKRNWDLFKYLFAEGAQLTPLLTDAHGKVVASYQTPADYTNQAGAYLESVGFFEKEIHRVTESYGNLVQVFSTYESFHSSKDAVPFARGINSIQLMKDRGRWYIVNITWQGETDQFPLPEKYVK